MPDDIHTADRDYRRKNTGKKGMQRAAVIGAAAGLGAVMMIYAPVIRRRVEVNVNGSGACCFMHIGQRRWDDTG